MSNTVLKEKDRIVGVSSHIVASPVLLEKLVRLSPEQPILTIVDEAWLINRPLEDQVTAGEIGVFLDALKIVAKSSVVAVRRASKSIRLWIDSVEPLRSPSRVPISPSPPPI